MSGCFLVPLKECGECSGVWPACGWVGWWVTGCGRGEGCDELPVIGCSEKRYV